MTIQRPQTIAHQVNTVLRQRIHDRTYPPGSRLPSESELAQELGVSRATVRTILAKFATEGLILRKQGDGTYVNERIRDVDTRYGGLWDFSRLIEANGYRPAIQTILLESRLATESEAHPLGISPGDPVLSMDRLFLADNRPAILVFNVIPAVLMKAKTSQLDSTLPIHKFLQTYCQEEIAYAISDVKAALVETKLASTLQCDSGTPLLHLVETFYNKNNKPLVWGMSYYNHLILRLRLIQAWG